MLWKICKLLSGWAVIHEADNVPKYPPAPLPPSYYIAPKESTHHSVSKKSFFSPALTTVWTKCFENICKFISAMASQLPPHGHPVQSVQNTQQHKDVSKSTDSLQDLLLPLDERILNVSTSQDMDVSYPRVSGARRWRRRRKKYEWGEDPRTKRGGGRSTVRPKASVPATQNPATFYDPVSL